jgi:hypothetical protein
MGAGLVNCPLSRTARPEPTGTTGSAGALRRSTFTLPLELEKGSMVSSDTEHPQGRCRLSWLLRMHIQHTGFTGVQGFLFLSCRPPGIPSRLHPLPVSKQQSI